jgi:GH24 family phage-related lysozyme (muramidase)/orotate phosphoribosyltransferase-like protein
MDRIASVAIRENPRIQEAALKVVENGKLVRDMAELYRVNINELGDAVIDLRKMKGLPVDKIMEVYQGIKERNGRLTLDEIAKRSNVSMEDAIWVLRRKLPDINFRTTPSEIKEIIKLKEQGLTNDQITQKTRIGQSAILQTILKVKPELVKTVGRDIERNNKIFEEYLSLTKNEGKTHEEARKILLGKYFLDSKQLLSILKSRDVKAGTSQLITKEEENLIIDKANQGISAAKIAEEIGRSNSTVIEVIKRLDSDLYKKNYVKKIVPENVKFYVVDSFRRERKIEDIISLVKDKFDYDLSYDAAKNIKRKYFNPASVIKSTPFLVDDPSKPKGIDEPNTHQIQKFNDEVEKGKLIELLRKNNTPAEEKTNIEQAQDFLRKEDDPEKAAQREIIQDQIKEHNRRLQEELTNRRTELEQQMAEEYKQKYGEEAWNKRMELLKNPRSIYTGPSMFSKASSDSWYKTAQLEERYALANELLREAGWKENFITGIMAAIITVLAGSTITNAARKYNVPEKQLTEAMSNPEQVNEAKQNLIKLQNQKHTLVPYFQDNKPNTKREIKMNNSNPTYDEIYEFIKQNEGYEKKAYRDSRGHLTVGIGFNLDQPGAKQLLSKLGIDYNKVRQGQMLDDLQIKKIFNKDADVALMNAKSFANNYDSLPKSVKLVLIDMAFNLGGTGLNKFANLKQAIESYNYQKAAVEMKNSLWYKQVPQRASKLIAMVQSNPSVSPTTLAKN